MFVSPDCYVAFGVSDGFDKEVRYVPGVGGWEGAGLCFGDRFAEHVAATTWGAKRDLYASLGVGEYWMFDPSGGDHYGFALRGETAGGRGVPAVWR